MTGIRKKQIIVAVLVVMIIAAGYLQYSYKKSSISTAEKESGRLGEAVYVENEDGDETVNSREVSTSGKTDSFFAQAKLDRDTMLSKNKEALKQITEDSNADKSIKADAYDKMMEMIDYSMKEQNIETLVKERGFNDCIAVFGDNGSLDIIVKASSLSSAQTAQIADIAIRHANVDMNDIHIKNMY
jgi:stage III sporulation protein AH